MASVLRFGVRRLNPFSRSSVKRAQSTFDKKEGDARKVTFPVGYCNL